MFGIDLPEFLLIVFVAVVVIGPKDLPRALYMAGKFIRKIKSYTADIQKTLDKIMEEGELEEIVRNANKPGGDDLQQKIDRQIAAEAEDRTSERADAANEAPPQPPHVGNKKRQADA